LSRIGASLELIEQTVSEMRLFVERFVHIWNIKKIYHWLETRKF
jgi:hypothetical protein